MSGPHPSPDPDARIERLEEAMMFTDRAAEELNQSMLDLADRLTRLAARLERLEQRLDHFTTPPVEVDRVPDEPPPHSSRPRPESDQQ